MKRPAFGNCGFLDFDKGQGWDIATLIQADIKRARKDLPDTTNLVASRRKDLHVSSDDDVNHATVDVFFGTWLFFGIWHEVVDRPIPRSEGSFEARTMETSDPIMPARYITAASLYQEFLRKQDQLQKI